MKSSRLSLVVAVVLALVAASCSSRGSNSSAPHYAMIDTSYDTTFGPSTPGHLSLISGQTHGVTKEFRPGGAKFPADDVVENGGNGQGTLIGDAQPSGDDCSSRDQVQLSAN